MMSLDDFNIISRIIKTKPCTWVNPREFFISWSGVPTLAYCGFSRPLLAIKQEIEEAVSGIKPENPGSRWPKTTLGALRDGRTLSLEEARILRTICDDLKPKIEAEGGPLQISQLSVVVFQCRSLEQRLLTQPISLQSGNSMPAGHEPPDDHLKVVDATMDQFSGSRLSEYLPSLQADGNRESHYRATHIESTLVFDLAHQQPEFIDQFIEAVDRELPGFYCWFTAESRHMTVRGLA